MKKIFAYLPALLVGILIGCFLLFGLVNLNIGQSVPKVTGKTVLRDLESASELVTTHYHYSRIGRFENSLEINGWSIPLTDKYFILTYEGDMLLGTDLSQADVQVDESKKTISVTLAPVSILSNALDESSIEVYDESKNIFNPISISDYKEFAMQQKEQMEEEIQDASIYSIAQENTVQAVKDVLQLSDSLKEEYSISVQFSKD